MDIGEAVTGLFERYKKEIKPLIETGKYLVAYTEMCEIASYLEIRMDNGDLTDLRHGWNMTITARQLCEQLKGGKKPTEYSITSFEAYAAQASMRAQVK